MEFGLSDIEFSRSDIKRKIKLPQNLTLELAEFVGIMVGDGHIGTYKSRSTGKKSYTHYELDISGNSRDLQYYEQFVNDLFLKLFNTKFNITINSKKNCVRLRKDSKVIYQFLTKRMNLPPRKDNVSIPDCILKSDLKIKAAFIRGLADADFCLTSRLGYYPRIRGASKSEILIRQVRQVLEELGIQSCYTKEIEYYAKRNQTYIRHGIYVNGFSRVEKYMALVGFSNEHSLRKYQRILNIGGSEGI